MTDDDKRNEARLNAAIEAIRPFLDAANRAAHDLESGDDDDALFDRMEDLGFLVAIAARLCGPGVRVLTHVANLLVHMNHHHTDEQTQEAAH